MDAETNGLERRDFLKVLGAAGAGAATLGCSGEAERLIPYVVPPEEIVPGLATWYRTTCRECPAGCGMSVRTREGRAIKAEGNPLSPVSHGALCPRGQASLHGLYNPDRIPQALARDGESWARLGWDEAEQQLADALGAARGRAVFLTEAYPGSFDRLLDDWCAAMGVERVKFNTFGMEPIREAHRRLYGTAAVPVHDFSQAEVVASFGADFMETWLAPVDYAHGFVQAHAYEAGRRGRFIAVTPHQSLTDMNADQWLDVVPGTEHLVALAMARLVADVNGGGRFGSVLDGVDVAATAEAAGVEATAIEAAAAEFARRPSLAVGPGVASQHRAATAVAAAVAILNEVAGNVGRSVHLDRAHHLDGISYGELLQLVDRLGSGAVQALLVHGPNPLHAVPLPDGGADALAAVPFVASFSSYLDETAQAARLLLPDHHFLESWGDHIPRTGVRSLVQPVMTPVFDTKQTGDVLLSVARRAGAALPSQATSYYDYLRESWQRDVFPQVGGGAGFDEFWRQALQAGVVTTDETAGGAGTAGAGALSELDFDPAPFDGDDGLYLVVYPSIRFYDGRLANRPWLQELPDPVSKMTWESWVEVNPHTADELGLDIGHIVEIETAHATVELPVWRHPGVRRDTIAVQLGQGHEALGRWARGRGVNAARLIGAEAEAESGAVVWAQTRAAMRPTGRWEKLPISSTQDSESGRHVISATTLAEAVDADEAVFSSVSGAVPVGGAQDEGHGEAEGGGHGEVHPNDAVVHQLQKSGGFAPAEMEAAPSDYPPPGTHYGEYSEAQPRWAMAIDLERCIGCSACMTACQAENNLPIVGPELVAQGRIVNWMRIERYFEYDDAEELHGTNFLPMLCQQCGNAPCEPVCPVFAAYHTPDGLNAQVYNRCVGTRYCANNCPYKVRYFNYFTYEWPEPLNWQLNPEVTVREKGVMEKCTFCVQRIRDAQQQARIAGRPVQDGEIVPACAQTCPGEAIVFGNAKDPDSRVSRIAASGRGFRVFEALNTQSAITYLKPISDAVEEH